MNLDKIKLFIILFSSILYGQNNDFFDKANELYNEGKYYDAIENYNLILDEGCLLYTSPSPRDLH